MITKKPNILDLSQSGKTLTPYKTAHAQMLDLLEKRINDQIEDTFILVQHPSTITRGKGLQWTGETRERAMPLTQIPEGTEFFDVERGGDLTWHGPGQLVIYPIVKLGDKNGYFPQEDIGLYIRTLEKLIMDLLNLYGVNTIQIPNATGVWVLDSKANALKIASIGLAFRKWVSYHGIGLNLTNSLEDYQAFSPCGFESSVMTNLQSQIRNEKYNHYAQSDLFADVVSDLTKLILK